MSHSEQRMPISIKCAHCRSDDIQKRGKHSGDGVPQFFCKACGRYFRKRYKAKARRESTRQTIRQLLTLDGKSIREVARLTDVSPTTVSAHRRRGISTSCPMSFAYADPPYIGQAAKHYGHDSQCAEVDHAALIQRLSDTYTDGWALSCSSPSLAFILPLCPPDVRVMAWVKPFSSFKPGVGVAYAWEPVIVRGGRRRSRDQRTVRDWLAASITMRAGLAGVKPRHFAFWLFTVLNMQPQDTLADLFPGSGAVSQAWEDWRQLHITD
jgi:transposase-like protein